MGRSMMDVGSGPAGGKGREYGAVRGEEEGLPGRAQVRYGLRPRLYSPLAAAGEPQCSMWAALLHIAECGPLLHIADSSKHVNGNEGNQ